MFFSWFVGDLVCAVNELSRGECGDSCLKLLKSLESNAVPVNQHVVRLFARNFDVDLANTEQLKRMVGQSSDY